MLRQTLIVIALITMFATFALAADASGTYVRVSSKDNSLMVIHLEGRDGNYNGYIEVKGQRVPIRANEDLGTLLCSFVFSDGSRESFSASVSDEGMVMYWQGNQFVLKRDLAANGSNSNGFAPPDANGNFNFPRQTAALDPRTATPQQGRFYRYALPAGWTATETPLIVEMTDGQSAAAAGFIAGGNHGTPTEVVHDMMRRLPGENARVVATNDLGNGMVEIEWTFTRDGRQMKGAIAADVIPGNGAMIAVIECPLETYYRDSRALRAISGSVYPISPEAGTLKRNSANDSPVQGYQPAAQDRSTSGVDINSQPSWR